MAGSGVRQATRCARAQAGDHGTPDAIAFGALIEDRRAELELGLRARHYLGQAILRSSPQE